MDGETKRLLEEILAAVKTLDSRLAKLEDAESPREIINQRTPPEKKLSLKEFIINRAPSNGVQMTLTIAHYLEAQDGISPFNAADIEKGFRAARETVPSNINDKANMCVKNGYFMEEKSKKDNMKAWVITRTGEEVVGKGFGKTQQ